jgi:hypothetical protein
MRIKQKSFNILAVVLVLVFFTLSCAKIEKVEDPDKGAKVASCPNNPEYKWCEGLNKCVHITTEKCPDDYKSTTLEIAKQDIVNSREYSENGGKDLKVLRIVEAKCPECLIIDFEFSTIQNEKMKMRVSLDSWDYNEISIISNDVITYTSEECIAKTGRVVDPVRGACSDNENQIGEVYEFLGPNLCCVAK